MYNTKFIQILQLINWRKFAFTFNELGFVLFGAKLLKQLKVVNFKTSLSDLYD